MRSDAGAIVEDLVLDAPATSPAAGEEPDAAPISEDPPTEPKKPRRFLSSPKEAGTAPEDRAFRPDVEGLRGVAIVLVVLFHAWWLPLNGGYVGVDVFFVISGFVITGLLLRERASTNHTSLVAFYARRLRRIVPMASLVVVAAIVATHLLLNKTDTNLAASDGRWALVFLANIHLSHVFPSGLIGVHRPPSAIQQYWSLGIEEQFYLVYPTLFLVVAWIAKRWSLRAKLAVVLGAVVIASFVYSVVTTPSNGNMIPYYELTTRAWELALGGLVALGTPLLKRIPSVLAALMTWVGMGGILLGAFVYTLGKPAYPGSAVALPVLSAAVLIAGGTAAPRFGVEMLLRLAPFKWLGRWSFSIYLLHYPLLIIPGERWQYPTLTRQLGLVGVSIVLAALCYALIENPIRRSQFLTRHPGVSIGCGAVLIGTCIGLTYLI